MRDEIQIGGRKIGGGNPLFIVAECGVTCNYDMNITKKLIDTVADAGADAIKLIFWFLDEIFSDKTVEFSFETLEERQSKNFYELLEPLKFSLDEWREVKSYADEKGIILFSTVNSPSGIEYAEILNLPAYKLSSWEYNYHSLWKKIARIGKPMLLDTGPVYLSDVAKVMHLIAEEGNDQVLFMHCFHTHKPEQKNLRTIPYLRSAFGVPVGYSAPNRDDALDYVALGLGACALEKRLTLKRNLPGHHHAISKEPDEFKEYVEAVRDAHASLGRNAIIPSDNDLEERKKWFRHLVADRDMRKGTILEKEHIEAKRGEFGISPEFEDIVLGRALRRDLQENETLSWKDI